MCESDTGFSDFHMGFLQYLQKRFFKHVKLIFPDGTEAKDTNNHLKTNVFVKHLMCV